MGILISIGLLYRGLRRGVAGLAVAGVIRLLLLPIQLLLWLPVALPLGRPA